MMTAKDVLYVLEALETHGIDVWLEGGWGVDALLGMQTREHKDVDLIVRVEEVDPMRASLVALGFNKLVVGEANSGFLLRDAQGRAVDVRAITFDESGDGIYRGASGEDWTYPAQGFTGEGVVSGRHVRCLSADAQMLCHTGYVPGQKDFREVNALHERFGVPLPEAFRDTHEK